MSKAKKFLELYEATGWEKDYSDKAEKAYKRVLRNLRSNRNTNLSWGGTAQYAVSHRPFNPTSIFPENMEFIFDKDAIVCGISIDIGGTVKYGGVIVNIVTRIKEGLGYFDPLFYNINLYILPYDNEELTKWAKRTRRENNKGRFIDALEIEKYFKNNKSTFIHEYTHYLREEHEKAPMSSYHTNSGIDLNKYFNDQNEIDAYYTQALNNFLSSGKFNKRISVQGFIKGVIGHMSSNLIKHTSLKNRNKINKRLYTLYQIFKDNGLVK